MIVLDTNIVSELIRSDPDHNVELWMNSRSEAELFITAVTAAELLYGVARLPEGRRKVALNKRVQLVLEDAFADRVLNFTAKAAFYYAQLVAFRESRGRPIMIADAQIAAICRVYQADLITRNVKDFTYTGVNVVNPWNKPENNL